MTSTRRRRVGPSRLLLLLLCVALGGITQVRAASLPTGGSVAAGAATIGTASNKALTVTQTSSSAVINWQSFSVAQGYTVNFVQPSASSAILNRVTGSTPSTIAGSITANGQVYLVNPNGIAITATGTVNAAAFVASTLAISDDDFMAGKRVFTGNGASAAVSNAGIITIGRGGYAALLGGSVDNAGTITVPLGKVGLGSGEQATLDLSGDGFLQVAIPTSASGSGALVSNSGTISADGGLIQLSAAAAKDLARQAINMGGIVEARSVGGTSGNIVLAGSDGAVEVSGTLTATSSEATGGAITITGRTIALEGANLDASGATGGGTIRVGGGRQGTGTLAHAETLSVDSASTIKADATSTGNGGDVVLWSDELTTFAGTISARGGAISGDGGQAEVSGKALLSYTGLTDLSAANGSFGTLLLDPYNVTISDAADTSDFTASTNDSVINAATLTDQLALSNVTVSTGSGGAQAGNITVASALAWKSGSTLTLDAYHSIAINANITVAGSGGLVLTYGSDLTFASGKSVSYTNADGTAATTSQGGKLTINNADYTLLYSMADIDAIDTTSTNNYALATSLDATGTTYNNALVDGGIYSPFSTIFEGLGHTISGLSITSSADYVGLFASNSGTIRDIGLIGGSVSGNNSDGSVGGLVGYNSGTIINAYATGAVSGSGSYVGGLVGYNAGSITNSYASATVSGSGIYLGGLVGENDGAIDDSYATGPVSATSADSGSAVGGLVGLNINKISKTYATGAVSGVSNVGGLVGQNAGAIDSSYATGAVSGTSSVGGLVGYNNGTINTSYWDTNTSGQSAGIGSDNNSQSATALTTEGFLDGGSASGLGNAFTLTEGLYPYLTSLFPDGVQAVSGTAYQDAGVTAAASGSSGAVTVTAIADGALLGTATTGANGYYYIFAAAGAFDSGDSLLTYTTADAATGAANAATLATATSAAAQSGLTLYGNLLGLPTTATTLSANPSLIASLTNLRESALTAAGSNAAAKNVIDATTYQALLAAGPFTIDQAIDTAASLTFVTASGNALTVASPITVEAGGSLGLLSGGTLAIDALVTVQGAGAVTLAYDASAATHLTFGSGGNVSYTGSGGALSINNTGYTLLYSMDAIDDIDSTGLSGHYALANSLVASGTYTSALVGGMFEGTFEGLGHTITGLTIATQSSIENYAGLFAAVASSGVVRDIGLVGDSVSGSNYGGSTSYAGGLVGYNIGTIVNAYATGAVSSSGSYSDAGGLVGYNVGTIVNAYATGAVSSSYGGNTSYTGGLVGYNAGSIVNAYATGAVSSSGYSYAGGLVGYNTKTISNSYATGAVSGSVVGGLVGSNNGGTISNSYWDMDTSGQTSSAGGTGLTTADFQTLAAATKLGSAFGGGSGLYPYLTSFFPSGVQAVSGTAYKADGTTLKSSSSGAGLVYVRLGDGSVIATTTGANGYYYAFAASGSIDTTSGTGVLAYTLASTGAGATDAATYTTKATGSLSGVNVYGSTLTETADSSVATLSALDAAYATATLGTTAASLAVTNRTITALGSGFAIDAAASVTETLVVSVPGNLTIAAAGSVSAADVSLQASGAFINENGADAVTATNRWLIYSADSDGDTFGGLNSNNTAIWDTAAGATVSASASASASGNRYVFAVQPTVTITTTDASKTYGDTANVSANYTLSGAVNGVAGAYLGAAATGILSGDLSSTGSAASANAGSYGYTLGTLSVASGYLISLVNAGSLTVNKATLLVTAANASTTYGDAVPTLSYGVSGWKNGQTDSLLTAVTVTTDATATANAGGSYTTTASGGTLSGAASGNYSITYAAGAMTVNKATLTVTAANASMTYGDAVPTLSYGVSGWKNGQTDSLLTSVSVTTDASATANAGGSYTTTASGGTLSGAATGNYTITYAAGSMTVNKATLLVTAANASMTYGDAVPTLSYGVSGWKNSQTDSLLTGISVTTDASSTANAGGSYTTTASGGTLSGAASGNYTITYAAGAMTVNKATLLVTAADASMTYGDAVPTLSYGVSGWKNGQTDSLLGRVAVTTDATATSNAGGSYTTTASGGTLSGAASGNYTITYAAGSMTIATRPITVSAVAATSVYGDTPTLTYSVGGSGLVNGDALSGSLASATSASSVGVYAITQGTLANSNYNITSYTGNTLTISARPITVTANALSSYQGFAVPALTYRVGGSGLANGDTLSGALATLATSSSAVGSYAITRGSLAASANYAMTFVPGLLTVSTGAPSDTSALAPAVTRSWAVNNDWALPAAPTSPLELSFGGQGTLIFSSPDFDGLKRTPGTRL